MSSRSKIFNMEKQTQGLTVRPELVEWGERLNYYSTDYAMKIFRAFCAFRGQFVILLNKSLC